MGQLLEEENSILLLNGGDSKRLQQQVLYVVEFIMMKGRMIRMQFLHGKAIDSACGHYVSFEVVNMCREEYFDDACRVLRPHEPIKSNLRWS